MKGDALVGAGLFAVAGAIATEPTSWFLFGSMLALLLTNLIERLHGVKQ